MAFLGAFFKFILSLCEEDKEMFNFAKEIDELSQENTKIENQLEGKFPQKLFKRNVQA